jgi:hypothetical protein
MVKESGVNEGDERNRRGLKEEEEEEEERER